MVNIWIIIILNKAHQAYKNNKKSLDYQIFLGISFKWKFSFIVDNGLQKQVMHLKEMKKKLI